MALNRPFKNGLLLKGAYTFSKALNEADDDGWVGLTWNQPSQIDRNYARAGYDRPHMLQMGFVYELPFFREASGVLPTILKAWQINGIGSWVSGTPFTVGGDNGLLQQAGGTQTANVTGELTGGFGSAGPNEPWYDPSQFSQPGQRVGQLGPQRVPRTRRTGTWTSRCSRRSRSASYRMEFRAESTNVFNHTQWGNPVTGHDQPELHAHPDARPQPAARAARPALRVLGGALRHRTQVSSLSLGLNLRPGSRQAAGAFLFVP